MLLVGALFVSCSKDDDNDGGSKKTYKVTVSFNADEGTASASPTEARAGTKITLTATPKTGFRFNEWLASGGVTITPKDANSVEFTMPAANVTVTALFEAEGSTKAELDLAIETTLELNSSHYTPESWADVEIALEAAVEVSDDPDATNAEILEAYTNLKDAVDSLEALDKDDLNAAIDGIGSLDENAYTSDSWADVEAALQAAEEVANDPDATVAEIAKAIEDLEAAVEGLELKPAAANKTTLAAKINEAELLNEDDYTPATWANFEIALARAQSVNSDATATQAEIDGATSALTRAIAALQHKTVSADKSQLTVSISDAEKLSADDYTTASWNDLQTALNAARTVRDNPSATQSDVQTAYNNLQTAVDNLVPDENNDMGIVRTLVSQLEDGVQELLRLIDVPIVGPAAARLLAPTIDGVRDTLVTLLGGVDGTIIEGLSNTLDDTLRTLGLDELIDNLV